MGVSSYEKVELAAYEFKDVSETFSTPLKDNRDLRAGTRSCKIFRRAFIDSFFPREKMKERVEEFINYYHGGMSVKEYSLKFNKLFKYISCFVFNPR